MKPIEPNASQPPDKMDQPCFPPDRIGKLLLALKVTLGRGSGAPLSFEDWGRWVGRPANTLASWCGDGQAYQLQALLASLECLPESERHLVLDAACRLYPTLHHRRLAHDFVADPAIFPLKSLFKPPPPPLHLVAVSPARECPEWLHVEVQAP